MDALSRVLVDAGSGTCDPPPTLCVHVNGPAPDFGELRFLRCDCHPIGRQSFLAEHQGLAWYFVEDPVDGSREPETLTLEDGSHYMPRGLRFDGGSSTSNGCFPDRQIVEARVIFEADREPFNPDPQPYVAVPVSTAKILLRAYQPGWEVVRRENSFLWELRNVGDDGR